MKSLRELDSVGWRFWIGCTVVLFGPSLYFMLGAVYEEQRATAVPYVYALIIAMIAASVVAACLNSILQKLDERRQELVKLESDKPTGKKSNNG